MYTKKDGKSAKVVRSKAYRVAQTLAKELAQNKYAPGSILPTDQKLADQYGVSRITMRKALSLLESRGLVIKLPQRGLQ